MPKDIKGQARTLKILIADDNRDHTDTFGLLLQAAGHQVHISYDGASALEMALAVVPDVMLLDIGMPLPDGHDLAREIRRQPWGRSTYLIAISAWGTEQHKQRSLHAGFNRHLTKPVDFDDLVSILNSIPRGSGEAE
jgi:DNA-binding response OmpR family regulator